MILCFWFSHVVSRVSWLTKVPWEEDTEVHFPLCPDRGLAQATRSEGGPLMGLSWRFQSFISFIFKKDTLKTTRENQKHKITNYLPRENLKNTEVFLVNINQLIIYVNLKIVCNKHKGFCTFVSNGGQCPKPIWQKYFLILLLNKGCSKSSRIYT